MTDEFLFRQGLHPECIRPDVFKASYIADIKAGLDGKESSLLMLPTYLPADIRVRNGETAVSIDIGGTNLKVAVLKFENGRFEILKHNSYLVPGLSEELSKDAFFMEIAQRLLPFADYAGRIGICFSHAAQILPNLDGRLISFSKEIRVTNAEGVKVAGEISEKLALLGVRSKKTYTLLNDSAATLLGGAALSHDAPRDCVIGLVLGTGMNLSYIEKTSEISKLSAGYDADTMIINTETGNFSAMPFGPVDSAFDAGTIDPGSHRLEKMASGKYLGELIHLALKKAGEADLLSNTASICVHEMDVIETPEAGTFLSGCGEGRLDCLCNGNHDYIITKTIIDRVFERAAKLTALAVLSVIEKTGSGRLPEMPALVVAEGSTINKLYSMKERFLKHMRENAGQLYYEIISPDNATLIGAALSAFRHSLM